jgi:hypothetical protein
MNDLKNIICNGLKPTEAFNQLIESNPEITNSELALLFENEFPEVSSEAVQVIWHWQRPGKKPGIDDNRLNENLVHLLKEAGYQVR